MKRERENEIQIVTELGNIVCNVPANVDVSVNELIAAAASAIPGGVNASLLCLADTFMLPGGTVTATTKYIPAGSRVVIKSRKGEAPKGKALKLSAPLKRSKGDITVKFKPWKVSATLRNVCGSGISAENLQTWSMHEFKLGSDESRFFMDREWYFPGHEAEIKTI